MLISSEQLSHQLMLLADSRINAPSERRQDGRYALRFRLMASNRPASSEKWHRTTRAFGARFSLVKSGRESQENAALRSMLNLWQLPAVGKKCVDPFSFILNLSGRATRYCCALAGEILANTATYVIVVRFRQAVEYPFDGLR